MAPYGFSCSICILQCCGILWDCTHCVWFGPAPCLGLVLVGSSHGFSRELQHWLLYATSVTWSSGCHRETCSSYSQPASYSPRAVPNIWTGANSGKIKKYLNCEIQLSLASASEQSFPCPVKSPHGFVRRHDYNALWCTPYRTARHGKPMTISSSYIIHWHDFMLASLAVLVIFYWGQSSSILQFASHHGSSYPQNFSFSLSIYLHPDRAVGCS